MIKLVLYKVDGGQGGRGWGLQCQISTNITDKNILNKLCHSSDETITSSDENDDVPMGGIRMKQKPPSWRRHHRGNFSSQFY